MAFRYLWNHSIGKMRLPFVNIYQERSVKLKLPVLNQVNDAMVTSNTLLIAGQPY